jgi:uncharacterized protein YwgA
MPQIGRKDMLLLLIGIEDAQDKGLGGITRIQKLLYLLESEEGIKADCNGFEFEPYKAGPYSPRLYDDLEFLENLNFIRRVDSQSDDPTRGKLFNSAEASEPEKAELDLTFDQLMGPEDVMESDEVAPTADSYEESRYLLTESGKKKVEDLIRRKEYDPFIKAIRRVKSRFSRYSLNDLLYYVYTRHPEMTTESEIKEKVLRRRPA